MSRNVQLQVLRGTQSQFLSLQSGVDSDTGLSANPLQMGEMYLATDVGQLYFGTPGIGRGYIQIGDTTQVNETLLQMLMELRALRLAIVALVCEGGKNKPQDFDPEALNASLVADSTR